MNERTNEGEGFVPLSFASLRAPGVWLPKVLRVGFNPAEAGAARTFSWPAAGRELAKRSFQPHPVSAAPLLSRGCPIPQSPNASLSEIHLSPPSSPRLPGLPRPDLKPGRRREAGGGRLPPLPPPPPPPPSRAAAAVTAASASRRLPQTRAQGKGVSKARERGASPGRGGGGGEGERAEGRGAEEGPKGRGEARERGEGTLGEGAGSRGGELRGPRGRRRGREAAVGRAESGNGGQTCPGRVERKPAGPGRAVGLGSAEPGTSEPGSDTGARPPSPRRRPSPPPSAGPSGMSEGPRRPGR